LEGAVTGAHVSLTILRSSDFKVSRLFDDRSHHYIINPCESNLVKWISLFPRPSRTDRWLSERLNSYLSSRCFIGRDYTLPQERVKQANSYIIDDHNQTEKNYVIPNA
jgi:hypothetical protein